MSTRFTIVRRTLLAAMVLATAFALWGSSIPARSEEAARVAKTNGVEAAAKSEPKRPTQQQTGKKQTGKKKSAGKKPPANWNAAARTGVAARPSPVAGARPMLARNESSRAAANPGTMRSGAASTRGSGEMMDGTKIGAPIESAGELRKHTFTPYAKPVVPPDHLALAKRIDELLEAELKTLGVEIAPQASDEDFLRRVSFDLAGVSPSPEEVTLFGLDPEPQKRSHVIERLLDSQAYGSNWARYWRDVIYSRAVEMRARLGQQAFETWIAGELRDNVSWADVATKLLTATGNVRENGETALIYAQRAEPDEVAAETARIFLGIQLQCANCHDHPSDKWKRDEFHALAAFFPRMQVRPVQGEMRSFELVSFNGGGRGGYGNPGDFQKLIQDPAKLIQRLDQNKDGRLSRQEMRRGQAPILARLFDLGDSDKDGMLTADEIRKIPPPPERPGRGSSEYYMPDLQNPQSAGTKFDPAFFLNGKKPGEGLSDLDRRVALASYITSPENPWFARSFVNRMWAQLLGEGFTMPVDDMGPERTSRSPEVLDALSRGFIVSGYDVKWLLRTIVNTQAYQRRIRPKSVQENPPAFAAAMATKLRADQLYDSITRVLGVDDLGTVPGRPRRQGVPRFGDASPRGQFNQLFGFDPSTSPDEQQGNLPQALFLMNSPVVHLLIAGKGDTRLAGILAKHSNNDDALRELYLLVHAREPSEHELKICREYIRDVQNRQDAFEDILWSLINSTEFHTRR